MKTKHILSFVLALCVYTSPFVAYGKGTGRTVAYGINIPSDLKIVAIAGGIAPWTDIVKVEINAKGEGTYWLMPAEHRKNGVYRKMRTFTIKRSLLDLLYRAVERSDFFDLDREYIRKNTMDGSFAVLTITAKGKRHTVLARNLAVKAVDDIMVAVNIALPEGMRVVYNEILR